MTTTRRRPLFPLLLLLLLTLSSLVSYSHAFLLPSSSPITHTHLTAGKQSPEPQQEAAEEEGAGGGIISGLFSIFFGKKEAKPLGFDRISVASSPEVYPATTTEFADPLPGDSRDVAALRPLLAQTRLEKAPLTLAYDAVKDGWKPKDFHRKLDTRGAALVVARSRGGAVFGGYNPDGWEGAGDERRMISAFLFTWPRGMKASEGRPIKCPKVGSAEYAVDDNPSFAIRFGYEDLQIMLKGDRKAISRLGPGYAKLPGGASSLFAPSEGKMAEIVDLKVYIRKGR